MLGRIGKVMTNALKDVYLHYFGFAVANTDKLWVPNMFCNACRTKLYKWSMGEKVYFTFSLPMLWRNPKNHVNDCYFCLMNVGINAKKLANYKYPDVSSVSKPFPRTSNDPLPVCPGASGNAGETSTTSPMSSGSEVIMEERHLISQSELNDLIRDLHLSKQKAELLASRLQQWNYLDRATVVSVYRNRNQELIQFFKKEGKMCFCDNIKGLFDGMTTPYNPNEWRLFIDGSKYSLKAGLIHNGNIKPSVPIAHEVQTKESYSIVRDILAKIKYNEHQ